MSQTISVSTTMGEQGFRDFAVFDAFHHRKAWLRPAVFAAIMLAFAAVCLSQLGKRPGAGLLDAVLAKNPDARICISAIALETLSAAAAALTARGLAAEVVQLAVSRTKQAGRLHLLMANNPIFLITGIRK